MDTTMENLLADATLFLAEQQRFLAEDAGDDEYLRSDVGAEDLVHRLGDAVRTATSLELLGIRRGDARLTTLAQKVKSIVHEYRIVLLRRCGWSK